MQGKTGEAPQYDFDFILRSLGGLIPVQDNLSGINPAMIAHVDRDGEKGYLIIALHNGMKYHLTPAQVVELEMNIKRRLEDQRILQKEAIKDQHRMNAEALAELQAGIAPGRIMAPWPAKKGKA